MSSDDTGELMSDTAYAESQRKILNRLRRANGQLTSIIASVESGADCRDVVIQLAAASKALDRAGYVIIASAMRKCVTDPETADDPVSVDELEKLFLTLS